MQKNGIFADLLALQSIREAAVAYVLSQCSQIQSSVQCSTNEALWNTKLQNHAF